MPIYDCGDPDCGPCQAAFGPNRDEAIRRYHMRAEHYAKLAPCSSGPVAVATTTGGGQAARGGGEVAEKALGTSPTFSSREVALVKAARDVDLFKTPLLMHVPHLREYFDALGNAVDAYDTPAKDERREEQK